jgi:hypothetical protein
MLARHRLLAVPVAVALALPAGAQAAPLFSAAPGRVVLAVDDGSVRNKVDPTGASSAVAVPDGRTLLFGTGAGPAGMIRVARVGAGGVPDLVATIPVPSLDSSSMSVLRQDDGGGRDLEHRAVLPGLGAGRPPRKR